MADEQRATPHAAGPEDPSAEDPTPGAAAWAAAPGMEQFQRAALEAVRAARSMLDAAEAVLADPKGQQMVIDSLSAIGRVGAEAVGGLLHNAASMTRPSGGPSKADASSAGPHDADDGDDGVERITVR